MTVNTAEQQKLGKPGEDIYRKKIVRPKEIYDLPDQQRFLFEQGVKEIELLSSDGLFKPLTVQEFEDKAPFLRDNSVAISGILKKLNYSNLGEYLSEVASNSPAEFLNSINWYGQKIIEDSARERLMDVLGTKPFPPGVISSLEFNTGCFLVCKTLKEDQDNPFSYIMDFYRNGVVLPGFADSQEGGKQTNYITTSSFVKGLDNKLISGRFYYKDTEGKIEDSDPTLMPLEDLYNNDKHGFPLPSICKIIAHQKNQE